MGTSAFTRRRLLQLGGLAGLAAAAGTSFPAFAADGDLRPGATLNDLGPASTKLNNQGGVVAADGVLYVGSRNLDPPLVFGIDLASGRAVSSTPLGYMNSVTAMATDPTGRYVYAGGDYNAGITTGNLFRIDTTDPEKRAVGISATKENLQGLAVASDGTVYFGGRWTPEAAYRWDPATGETTRIGSLPGTVDRIAAVAVNDTTLYCGAVMDDPNGGNYGGVFAIDRATGVTTDITPPELLVRSAGVRDLDVFGDKLLIGVTAHTAPSPLVVMDTADHTSYTIVDLPGTEIRGFCRLGDVVYHRGGGYHLGTGELLPFPGGSSRGALSLSAWDGKLVGVSADTSCSIFDPETQTARRIGFLEAGVQPGPQMILGIAAGGGYAYACSNLQVTRHDLVTGETVDFPMNGESKSACSYDGVVWFAQYNGGGIWSYDSRTAEPPKLTVPLPAVQNRLLRVTADAVNDLILVGVQSDRQGAGAFGVFHRATGKLDLHVNPFDDTQAVRAVVSHEGVAYLGGENHTARGWDEQVTVMAFDPVAGKELWRMNPGHTKGTCELAVHGRHLYGFDYAGGLFVIDLTTRQVVHTADHSDLAPANTTLFTLRNAVYVVSTTTLFRLHPVTFARTVVARDLDGGWYGWPRSGVDEEGRIYTLRGRNLVQIKDPARF